MFNEKWKFLSVSNKGSIALHVNQPIYNVNFGVWQCYGQSLWVPQEAFQDFDTGKLYKIVGGQPTRIGA